MKLKSLLAKPFASIRANKIRKEMQRAVEDQEAILEELIKTGRKTEFGKDHHFDNINNYNDFKNI